MAIAALVTWIITAGFGLFMLRTWIAHGGARAGTATHFRPPVVFGHFALAAAGLVVWVIYLLTDSTPLAWVAFVDLLAVATMGDLLVLRWFKDRRAATGAVAPGSSGRRGATETITAGVTGVQLAEQRIPSAAVIAHGLLAVTTLVLVLLSALEIGGS